MLFAISILLKNVVFDKIYRIHLPESRQNTHIHAHRFMGWQGCRHIPISVDSKTTTQLIPHLKQKLASFHCSIFGRGPAKPNSYRRGKFKFKDFWVMAVAAEAVAAEAAAAVVEAVEAQ